VPTTWYQASEISAARGNRCSVARHGSNVAQYEGRQAGVGGLLCAHYLVPGPGDPSSLQPIPPLLTMHATRKKTTACTPQSSPERPLPRAAAPVVRLPF
jgi:hypothetical protein